LGCSMVKVYLVMPDLSWAKVEALARLSRERPVSILVSYSTFKLKPVTLERLRELRRRAYSLEVMLDSGAYHMARLGLEVSVASYADFVGRHGRLFDVVVTPDVPSDCKATIARTEEFKKLYGGPFMPVLQGRSVDEYVSCYVELRELGLTSNHFGVGGLDGPKKSPWFIKDLLARLCGPDTHLHLFGVGARLYRELSPYHKCIESIDSGAWQAEIRYRRRELEADGNMAELEYRAMKRYLERFFQPYPSIAAPSQSSTLHKADTLSPH